MPALTRRPAAAARWSRPPRRPEWCGRPGGPGCAARSQLVRCSTRQPAVTRGPPGWWRTYAPAYPPLTAVPVLGVRGHEDRLIPGSAVREWAHLTTGPFHYAEVSGGHMYLAEEHAELVKVVTEFVTSVEPIARAAHPSAS
jgi:pimeloyl-ACP methyl ester carboxylesterase